MKKKLIDFAVVSKGLDITEKIKLILFASGAKPNTYVTLKINPKDLDEKYEFEKRLKQEKVLFIASRQKGYEEIRKTEKNEIQWGVAGIWIGYDLFKDKRSKKDFENYKKLLAKQQIIRADKLAGKLYGYPKACVDAYIRETPGFIRKNYSYCGFYKRIHDSDERFPFVFHIPCCEKCKATAALNRKYENAVKKFAPEIYKEYRQRKTFETDIIIDTESDILLNGKTIWPEKDCHDYSVITKHQIEGKYYLIEYLSRKYYEKGTVLSAVITKKYDFAKIKIKKIKGIIPDLIHTRSLPVIGRNY
jgi:hypothetical protein